MRARKRATSLLEILVSSLILALLVAGLANVFVSSRRLVLHARSRSAAAEMSRLFIAPLQLAVDQRTWDNPSAAVNSLALGTSYCDGDGSHTQNVVCAPYTDLLGGSNALRYLDLISYAAEFNVSLFEASPNPTGIRRAVIRLLWTEYAP